MPGVGVGMPAWIKLNLFGQLVRDAFPGTMPYLVGSAADSKEWRDVDVRVMVTPDEYERFIGEGHRQDRSDEPPAYYHQAHEDALCNGHPAGRRRTAITLAFAELGRTITGLPIDFQFDLYDPNEPMSQTDGKRIALGGVVELRHAPEGPEDALAPITKLLNAGREAAK